MLMSLFLNKLDLKADLTTSAKDGLRKLRQEPEKYHLVISDFNLPEINGGVMCLEMRKDPRLSRLPFICCSGNLLSESDRNRYEIDEVLTKPFSAKEIQEAVLRHMKFPSSGTSSTVLSASVCERRRPF